MIVAIFAALALQAAAPAQGDAKAPPAKSSQTTGAAKTTDQPDPDKKICRRQTPIGSTIEQRICKTQAQWDVEAENAHNSASQALSGLGTAGK